MTQMHFPIFPDGVTYITKDLAFEKAEGKITYFNWNMPIFSHDENDFKTFRMITSQFCANGNAKQMDIVRAFGVTKISVKRSVKKYREQGPEGFYSKPATRGATVLTPEVLSKVQQMLYDGLSISEVAEKREIKKNTLDKAVLAGRLIKPVKKKPLRT